MTTIEAVVRNGRIEVDKPIDLPDGTKLTIPLPGLCESLGIPDEKGSDTPDAIENWVQLYNSLEPLEFTPEERAALQTARREQKEFELADWERHSKQIEGTFP